MTKVRARRLALRVEFSTAHLARLTGISASKLSLIERDLVEPTPYEREKIAKALQCSVYDLWSVKKQEVL